MISPSPARSSSRPCGLSGDALHQRFLAVETFLRESERFWRISPFTTPRPAWCELYPALEQQALALDEPQRDALERNPQALLLWMAAHWPKLGALDGLLDIPQRTPTPAGEARESRHDSVGVPGRKWAQIQAFAHQVPPRNTPLLDWCSGKAHLGRTLAQRQHRPLHAVERNAALCNQGRALAERHRLQAQFHCLDVLSEPVPIPTGAQVLALHACGDLHRSLLNNPQLEQAESLLLAPCCYHLWLTDDYQPLSALAKDHDLALDRNSVQLAVQETVKAPARELKQQATLAAWRLGFDSLQRELRGMDAYWNTPSVPHRALAQGFPALCRRLAEHKGLTLPEDLDWPAYEARGWQRLHRARRLQLPRQAFRRALELWLVLDLALALQDRGFTVELSVFCPREISPRNLLLSATR